MSAGYPSVEMYMSGSRVNQECELDSLETIGPECSRLREMKLEYMAEAVGESQ